MFIAGVIGEDHETSTSLLKDLGENSSLLEQLVEDFGITTVKYEMEIRCFFETRKTQIPNAVLNRKLSNQIEPGLHIVRFETALQTVALANFQS